MRILAVDPGTTQSAFVFLDGERILDKGLVANERLEELLTGVRFTPADLWVIEKIQCFGMVVSESIFETVYWTGRFAVAGGDKFYRIPRMPVKIHFCHSSRAKDSNIIQSLKDRFEPDLLPRQRPKGILNGVRADEWQALALAVYAGDNYGDERWRAELKK
uniref:Uncharacterized protein n=1 Tax=viral metagenome TaxID=1070528 RepID=A0A6H1Z7R9_9ZZZZ